MTVGTLPGNRFNDPDLQFCDTTGAPYAGGFLYFYASGTSTPQNTYSNADLDSSHANANPIVLDSAGRAGTVWLQKLAYKVVLQDVNSNQIWSMDPVYTSDYSAYAQFFSYAGNPNGNVAGSAGSATVLASVCWDRTNNLLYVCTTTGNAAAAVWTQVAGTFPGSITFPGVITPTILASDTNNYAPTSFSTAYLVRMSASTTINLTGLAGGASGREIVVSNIGTNNITFIGNSTSSSAGNRFLFPRPIVLRPTDAISLNYDSTSSGWRAKDPLVAQPIAGGFKNLKVQTTSNTLAGVTADELTLEDANGEAYRAQTVSLAAIDNSTNGANGLDTGSVASSTWYSVWVILAPATNTVAGLLSTATAFGSLTLPAGYTFGARVGMLRTDGSAHWLRTLQYGRIAQYVVGTNPTATINMANGTSGSGSYTSPTFGTVAVANYVPTTAVRGNFGVQNFYHNTTAVTSVLLAPNTGYGGANKGPGGSASNSFFGGTDNNTTVAQSVWMLLEGSTVAWFSGGNGGGLDILGWEDGL